MFLRPGRFSQAENYYFLFSGRCGRIDAYAEGCNSHFAHLFLGAAADRHPLWRYVSSSEIQFEACTHPADHQTHLCSIDVRGFIIDGGMPQSNSSGSYRDGFSPSITR